MSRKISKLSIVIPVYFNQDNLWPLYNDIKKKIIDVIDYEYEIILVNDGSKDDSWTIMQEISDVDPHVRNISLSKNFGSHAAVLCGLSYSTGDCAVTKAADLQEPTELILEMVEEWQQENNVVLALREDREEGNTQVGFANLYYWLTRKVALPNMPKGGFDVFLLDRKVIEVLCNLEERNSSLNGQILWSGFQTAYGKYVRKAREIGKSRWTLRKKIRLVSDTLFSFSLLPIKIIISIGITAFMVSVIWAIIILIGKLNDSIPVTGWTTLMIFQLLSFGIIMITLGILGEYLWRTFDASRNRPPFIVEKDNWNGKK